MKHKLKSKYDIRYFKKDSSFLVERAYDSNGDEIDLSDGVFGIGGQTDFNKNLYFKKSNGDVLIVFKLYINKLYSDPYYFYPDASYYREQKIIKILK